MPQNQPNPSLSSHLGSPLLAGLMRRRKVAFRLRRRKFTLVSAQKPAPETPASTPAGADDTAQQQAILSRRIKILEAQAIAVEGEKAVLEAQLAEAQATLADRERSFEEAKKVVEDARAQVLRARGDMDLQRRRFAKEKEDLQLLASEGVVRALFPVLDNFGLALGLQGEAQSPESIVTGVTMIHREFSKILAHHGLQTIDALGQTFDPHLHDAVATGQDEAQPNKAVLAVLRPGYTLHGKVLRPAMVRVNQLAGETTPPPRPRVTEPPADAIIPPAIDLSQIELNSTDDVQLPPVSPLDQAKRMLDTRF